MPIISKREPITFAEAIREALDQAMAADNSVFVIGEGVPDPKGIFGTTTGLRDKYGAQRILDMPLSENGMTGVCIGAAIQGMRPVMVHQRIDFTLLALDQLVNNAAKWSYMFNGQMNVPLVVRAIVGRGWGQGPQHSQSLQATFAHIPGLRVVMPATPYDAKGLLLAAITDNSPVMFIEHRWLHGIRDHVPETPYFLPLDTARTLRQGDDVTIVAFSYMAIEALRAAKYLAAHNIDAEIISMHAVNPLDMDTVHASVKRTGKLLIADCAARTAGVAAEITARVCELSFSFLHCPPRRISLPDHPVPTSPALANQCYSGPGALIRETLALLDCSYMFDAVAATLPIDNTPDIPNHDFMGPF